MVWDRSPWATAPMTRAVSLVGWTRSPIRVLTEVSASSQEPLTAPSEARWLILPSLPTTRLIRSSSLAIRSLSSMTSLNVSATFPATPVQSSGRRTVKSPFFNAVKAVNKAAVSIPCVGGSCSAGISFSPETRRCRRRANPRAHDCDSGQGVLFGIPGDLHVSRSIRSDQTRAWNCIEDGHHVPTSIPVRWEGPAIERIPLIHFERQLFINRPWESGFPCAGTRGRAQHDQ